MPDSFTPEQWAAASRAAQGLPPTVEDPAVLSRVVDLLKTAPEPRRRARDAA